VARGAVLSVTGLTDAEILFFDASKNETKTRNGVL
jgi:hypothetical protein